MGGLPETMTWPVAEPDTLTDGLPWTLKSPLAWTLPLVPCTVGLPPRIRLPPTVIALSGVKFDGSQKTTAR